MKRREFITFVGASAAAVHALPAAAQQTKRLPVVAWVSAATPIAAMMGPDPTSPLVRAFVHGLRDLGWHDGRNVIIERRSAEGDPKRAPAIMAELLARDVDVINVGGRWLIDAAQQATKTIPIVAAFGEDPVAAGLISSFARPGGNLTGVTSTTSPEFLVKRLALLRELAPRTMRPAFVATKEVLEQLRTLVLPAGITMIPINVEVVDQFEGAFATVERERADALMISTGAVFFNHAARIVTFAALKRLPGIYSLREAVDGGGLISYGMSATDRYRKTAQMVARFLEGARLGDVPVEHPTKFELVVNAKTAAALGIAIPPSLRAQGAEVVE